MEVFRLGWGSAVWYLMGVFRCLLFLGLVLLGEVRN